MAYWQIALLALGFAWFVQAVGTWLQMRHYRSVLSSIAAGHADGHLGAGNARGRLGKGVIAIVVADGQDIVRDLQLMEGRSVFAKFKPFPDFVGRTLDELTAQPPFPSAESGRNEAVASAIAQLRKARTNAATAWSGKAESEPAGGDQEKARYAHA